MRARKVQVLENLSLPFTLEDYKLARSILQGRYARESETVEASEVSYDPCSYRRNFCNCLVKPEKVKTSMGLEPATTRLRCDALTN